MNSEIYRTVHRAEFKPAASASDTEDIIQNVHRLTEKVTRGDILTISLFRWHTTLFLYAEGIGCALFTQRIFCE